MTSLIFAAPADQILAAQFLNARHREFCTEAQLVALEKQPKPRDCFFAAKDLDRIGIAPAGGTPDIDRVGRHLPSLSTFSLQSFWHFPVATMNISGPEIEDGMSDHSKIE